MHYFTTCNWFNLKHLNVIANGTPIFHVIHLWNSNWCKNAIATCGEFCKKLVHIESWLPLKVQSKTKVLNQFQEKPERLTVILVHISCANVIVSLQCACKNICRVPIQRPCASPNKGCGRICWWDLAPEMESTNQKKYVYEYDVQF